MELQVEFKEAAIKAKPYSPVSLFVLCKQEYSTTDVVTVIAKFFDCMTWLVKMDLILIFTLSKGTNGLVLNLASWESMRCVGIFVVLIIWILFVGSESCKLGNRHDDTEDNNHNKQFKLGSIIFVKVRQMC